jgi:AsmA-like C-terminal region
VMKNVFSHGELVLSDEVRRLQGVLTSSAGMLQGVAYRNLQTDITWSPAGVSFKDLRMGAFNGELRAGGSWNVTGGQTRELWLLPKIDALSLNEVLAQLAPRIKDRFAGQLDFRGEFAASARADGALRDTLKGSGTAVIRNGTIKDFNLLARLFYRSSGQGQNTNTTQRVSENLAAVLKREDTPVEELKATLTVEEQRVRTDNVSLVTAEYAISGVGWVGLDGTTQWNGLVVFSPAVSRELQREYGAIRYFLDRKGRLAISFRVDGKLPNVQIRPENRALAQALRWGTWQRGDDLTGRDGRGRRTWLPESLDRLLHR